MPPKNAAIDRRSSIRSADEQTPLLLAPDTAGGRAIEPNGNLDDQAKQQDGNKFKNADHAASGGTPNEEKPLPVLQVLALCYCSLVEPVAYFSIFPYINEMIERTGGQDVENVGFWAGTIESLFSLVQMLLMIFYGRLADRLGRKPVLVFSLAGVAGATSLFGLSASLWQMVALRCLAGCFAGSSVTIRAMLSENCTKTTQARAFSWYMFARNLGIFLGPLIGGALADPAEQYSIFKNVIFFQRFPYALPSFVSGAFCLSTVLVGFFCLKETLKPRGGISDQAEADMSIWQLLKAPGVAVVIYIYGHVMVQALAYTAVNPVFCYTPVRLGGFGFSPQYISIFITIAGASQALWMLLAFPSLQKYTSTGAVLRGCAFFWPFMMASFPVLNELLRAGATTSFWILALTSCVLGSGVSMAFACVQLCLNDIAPNPRSLATLNAIALTVNSALRAVAPVAFTSIFATGVKLGWADGHLVWFFLVGSAVLLNVGVRYLPEKAEGRLHKRKPTEDDEN